LTGLGAWEGSSKKGNPIIKNNLSTGQQKKKVKPGRLTEKPSDSCVASSFFGAVTGAAILNWVLGFGIGTGTGIRPTAAGNSLGRGELDLIKDFTLD